MTPSRFVTVLKKVVRDSAVDATLKQLQNPAGRKPDPRFGPSFKLVQRAD
jgi:hypothetical protein